MGLPLLAIAVLGTLALGYTLYGRLIARQYRLDDATKTPAEEVNDGVDFVPTRPFYLLGQHFSAIAAAGPIVGPIAACLLFGWLPCILWIGLGVVFIGAVHDFSALVASIRHKARSIAEIVKENLGRRAWLAILGFIWIAIVYVIIAFADVTASTFVAASDLEGTVPFNEGGAVAFASTAYLVLGAVMGLVQKRFNPPLWLTTVVFVPGTLFVVWLGTKLSTLLILPGSPAAQHLGWVMIIMVYCFVASLIPVWTLLQPRGYLGGFLLYMALAVGIVGIFFGGYEIKQPAINPDAKLFGLEGSLFPFLFVTIACGACSGFHGLVCSGTTSKQIARESHCIRVGYGGMLLEGFVALIALATVMIVAGTPKEKAGTLYGRGIGEFLTLLIGDGNRKFAIVFGTMVFSTFVFDTLDVGTRLGRLILQELTGVAGRAGAILATAATAGVPLVILLVTGRGAFMTFWTLFGTSNQLLAALTLMGVTVWLKRNGKRCWFTFLPMLFVLAITLWSLVGLTWGFLTHTGAAAKLTTAASITNGVVAVLLVALTALLGIEALRMIRRPSMAGTS